MPQINLDDIILPPDMLWEDEYNWSQVRQTIRPSVTGAQLIQMNAMQAGRPITLVGRMEGSDGFALVKRVVVDEVRAKEVSSMGLPMTLTLSDGRTFSVIFRYENGVAVEATPMVHRDPPDPNDYYITTIRLLTVS